MEERRTAVTGELSPVWGGVCGGRAQAGLERTEEGMGLLWVPAGCTPSLLCMVAVSVESILVPLVSLLVCPGPAAAGASAKP